MDKNNEDNEENLTPQEREWARLVNESLNLFTLPEPPEHLTPHMAKMALQHLIMLDQRFGTEVMRVMMGIHRLDPELGEQMVGFIPRYFGPLQKEIKQMIERLEEMEHNDPGQHHAE
jgi:hypothetical protein